MTWRAFDPSPECAVDKTGQFEFGRFGTPFARANMLDVSHPYHYPIPRFAKSLRLKEWQVAQFGDQRFFFFTALYNAKLLSLAMFMAWDRVEKKRFGFRRILPGSAFDFGESLDMSRLAFRSDGSILEFCCQVAQGRIRIEVVKNGRDRERSFSGSFTFLCGTKYAAPMTVCLPLGLNRAMYSTKMLMPCQGEFAYGNESYRLAPPEAMGIFDDHKGFYPWRMRFDWVAGFGLDAKRRRTGFNLTDNQVKDQERFNENCVWIGNKIWALPPVKVTRPHGFSGEWVIQDTEGLVDLVFIPEVPNDIRLRLGIVDADYHGPFGTFRGIVKTGEGDKLIADRMYGAGEQKYLRA